MNNFIKRAEQRLLQGPVKALGSHVSKDQWQPSQSDKKRTRKIRHYQNPLKSEFSPALPNEDLTSVCIMCPEMTFKNGLQTPWWARHFKPQHQEHEIQTVIFFQRFLKSCNSRGCTNFSETYWKMFWSHFWGFLHNNERQKKKCLSGTNKQFWAKVTEILSHLKLIPYPAQSRVPQETIGGLTFPKTSTFL